MKIGLIDVDGQHRRRSAKPYPNLALAKIAAYHKNLGDKVEWYNPLWGGYDRVYAAKIFNFSPDYDIPINAKEVVKGGTGYDIHSRLPEEIDRLQPDYSIYPHVGKKESYGFITRGCPNKCPWCVVPEKEGNIKPYMDIDEITLHGRRPNVTLMDNNILACPYGIEQLEKVADKGYCIDLNQGNSARLVTPRIAQIFASIRWYRGNIRFAADTLRQIEEIENAMQLIDGYSKHPRHYVVYTMIHGDMESCYKRLVHFRSNPRVAICAQPFRNPHKENAIPQWQRDMARWANRHEFFKAIDFWDFVPRKGFKCSVYKNLIN